MSEQNDFKMYYARIKCPVCGQSNYMRFLHGKNVGELDMKCLNCNSYFMSKDFPQIGQPGKDVPDTNVGDTIYRKDAINAVEFGITYAKAFNKETGEWTELFKESNEELREAVKRLSDLPPAQPQRCMNTIRRSDAIDALMKTFWFLNPDSITDVIMGVEDAQPNVHDLPKDADCISRQEAIDAMGKAEWAKERLKQLPPAQPELIEKVAYIRGFEQGRTQGMIDSQGEKK